MAAHPQPVLSAAQNVVLPEVIGFRDELLEGQRVLSRVPMMAHTIVIEKVQELLQKRFPEARVVRESGWYFKSPDGVESVPGPDLTLVSARAYRPTASGWFEEPPMSQVTRARADSPGRGQVR